MWSVRMRAQKMGVHVSGAERLVEKDLEKVIRELYRRPKDFDSMVITIEKVDAVEVVKRALPVQSYDFKDVDTSHQFAVELLSRCGVREEIARRAIEILKMGPNPKGGNMRGAILMDVETGERLEPDQERGIRTVRMDWKDRKQVERELRKRGMKPFYLKRFMDALAIATKNVYCGVLGEICWSDDPDYTTGYVSCKSIGYVRVKPMKDKGNPIGGRVYFVRREALEEVINCLEKKAILIEEL